VDLSSNLIIVYLHDSKLKQLRAAAFDILIVAGASLNLEYERLYKVVR
jgi:hypothetical protein